MQRVVIVDHGTGNLRSVARALEHVAGRDARIRISAEPGALRAASRLVFPGQGAIGPCMAGLRQRGLLEPLQQALRQVPCLGICLGLQMLGSHSEEDGGTVALNLTGGVIRRFPATDASGQRYKIPQMGWNQVQYQRAHPLFAEIPDQSWFYFVHSYYMESCRAESALALTRYVVPFVSVAGHDNLFATQFHPEKSQRYGLRLLQNFLAWDGRGD